MKNFMFAMLVVGIIIGCAHKEPVIPVPTDNVTATPTHDPHTGLRLEKWPEEDKKFWVAMYFVRLSHSPVVRSKFLPWWLYKVANCVIDRTEKVYDFEIWKRTVAENQRNVSPQDAQFTYNVTYGCANEQGAAQEKYLKEKGMAIPTLKESV
jgi:hypothetical protein